MESRNHQDQENNFNSSFYTRRTLTQEESLLLSKILPQIDWNSQKTTPLVVLNVQTNQFYLPLAVKAFFNSLEGECYIISISGNPLIGKSSFLNLLVSLYENQKAEALNLLQGSFPFKEVYKIGDGRNSTTEGIDMFCLSIKGKNYIFLDVEGDNDPKRKETGVWFYTNLIQTALGVSHIHIYNYNGVPQETFLKYFKSIHKIIEQTKLHPEFQTKLLFLKRNHDMQSDCHSQELEEIREDFHQKKSAYTDFDSAIHFLPIPPQHFTRRKSPSSCLTSNGLVCESCQEDLFFILLNEIHNEINFHLSQNQVTSFKNGKDFLGALQQILKINSQTTPFCLNQGHISNIRLDNLTKEQLRIKDGLLEARECEIKGGVSQNIFKASDFSNHAKDESFHKFVNNEMTLRIKLSQLDFLLPELTKFMDRYIFNDNASILDEKEKQILLETYIFPFKDLTEQILTAFQVSEKTLGSIYTNLGVVKHDTENGLRNYIAASDEATRRTFLSIATLAGSGIVSWVGREAALALVATGFSGGVLAAGLAVYSFVQAKKKWNEMKRKNEEMLNPKKIQGVNNKEEAEKELKNIEEIVTKMLKNLKGNYERIGKVCGEKGIVNLLLVERVKEVVDNKLKGINLTVEEMVELVDMQKAVENNVKQYKEAL